MNIDPTVSLAISVNAHKGVYALLIGSGVSKAAGIPTGWDVVIDLIRRVAKLQDKDPGQDAHQWYRDTYEKEPSYAELVQAVAPTAAERTSLLKEYFEPTVQEREDGLKAPTLGHQAIARRVAAGYFKVIITTNFDRLLERALEAAGVSPTVVSSPDQVGGMLPLPHVQCLVLKLHGDYLDTRIKNTPEELAAYDPETTQLLDRILSEYGLIVCGWSGEWDTALAGAISRNTRFRFSTYWLGHGKLTAQANDLLGHRRAVVVPIETADAAFVDLEAKVEALSNRTLIDPMSPRLAVATIKKFIAEPKYRIQLQDAIINELSLVRRQTNADAMPCDSPEPNKIEYVKRVRQVEAICAKLVPMVATGVYWDDGKLDNLWKRCIETLARSEFKSGHYYNAWGPLRFYPATLVLYAAGMAAILRRRFSLFRTLLLDAKIKEDGRREDEPAFSKLGTSNCFIYEAAQFLHDREGKDQQKLMTPGSDWVVKRLQNMLADVIGDDDRFEELFDELEFLIALVGADVGYGWIVGRFAWRAEHYGGIGCQIQALDQLLQSPGAKHPFLEAGLFNGEQQRFLKALAQIKESCQRARFGHL